MDTLWLLSKDHGGKVDGVDTTIERGPSLQLGLREMRGNGVPSETKVGVDVLHLSNGTLHYLSPQLHHSRKELHPYCHNLMVM